MAKNKHKEINYKKLVTIENIQKCFANANILYHESKFVMRRQTKFVLLEISLEEYIKAWAIFFLLFKDEILMLKDLLNTIEFKNKEKINDYFKDLSEIIYELSQPDITEIFRTHKIKLLYAEKLLNFFNVIFQKVILILYKVLEEQETRNSFYDVAALFNIKMPPVDDLINQIEIDMEAVSAIKKLFENLSNLDELKNVKESALYVNLNENCDNLISPDLSIFNIIRLSNDIEPFIEFIQHINALLDNYLYPILTSIKDILNSENKKNDLEVALSLFFN